jgi:valyl-tRNA synthetase
MFATQWAEKEADIALPRATVVSERFELGRNFCNKLWNASRFALMNLEGYSPVSVSSDALTIEDRWMLSRLATVTSGVTLALGQYQFADASRALYDFAWDEFCSFYLEMLKPRLQQSATRAAAQQLLAHTLDVLLRLLHPTIPFVTEHVWQLLGGVAPSRGLDALEDAAESVMVAPWPQANLEHRNPRIEQRFALFQAVLGGVREIRSRQNIPPKREIQFSVRCDRETADRLEPMKPYFESMARATPVAWSPDVNPPAMSAHVSLADAEIYVDLKGLIDIEAEIDRLKKERKRIETLISGKEKKLANEEFVQRAPAEVVDRERQSLAQLQLQLSSVKKALDELEGQC